MQIRGQKVTGHAILLALLASMGGFIFGYDTGQISGIVIMDDFKLRFASCAAGVPLADCTFNVWREGLIVASLSVGTAIGAICGAPIADRLGRRKAMTVECGIFSIGVVIQTAAFFAWYQVMIGRFVSGLGVGALSAVVPLYTAETAPKAIRGSLVGTYQLAITAGILVAACFNLGTNQTSPSSASWRIPIGLGIAFAAILGIGILFMPESPRWLEAHGRTEEARAAVLRLNGTETKEAEEAAERLYRDIKYGVAQEAKRAKAGWLDCFKTDNKTLYRTILGITLQAGQQLTGANYFFYYGASLFQGVVPGISPFVAQIILNAVNFICTFLGLYVMEKFGRRWPLIVGGLWQGAWLLVFATVGTVSDPETNRTTGTVMIVSGCLFILGYASTWAPGIWILISEMFPTRTRAKQGALSTLSNWTWNFLIAFFTQPITNSIGYSYGYIFAGSNIGGAVIVYFFLYDSAGLSLEAVDEMYNDPSVNPRNSGKFVPEGYSSRHVEGAEKTRDDDEVTLVGRPSTSKEHKISRKPSPQATEEMFEHA